MEFGSLWQKLQLLNRVCQTVCLWLWPSVCGLYSVTWLGFLNCGGVCFYSMCVYGVRPAGHVFKHYLYLVSNICMDHWALEGNNCCSHIHCNDWRFFIFAYNMIHYRLKSHTHRQFRWTTSWTMTHSWTHYFIAYPESLNVPYLLVSPSLWWTCHFYILYIKPSCTWSQYICPVCQWNLLLDCREKEMTHVQLETLSGGSRSLHRLVSFQCCRPR